jgi:hypothetical protein
LALIISRSALLITIITISTLIGGIFVINQINPSFKVDSALLSDFKVIDKEVDPQDYSKRGNMGIDQDTCCGHVDVTAPTIISSPPSNSIVLAGSKISLEIIDDNPFYDNEADEVLFHWEGQSNDSLVDLDKDFSYEVTTPSENGTFTLYVYAGDAEGNWDSAIFHYIVIPAGNPPTVNFVNPSTNNETLTGMYEFRVSVTDDYGPLTVKMQIDSGANPSMFYNEASDYYYRSVNVSELTNGYHWFKVTAVDIDVENNKVTKEIDFTVIGGQEFALVSDPPEWDLSRSDLPINLSDYLGEDKFSDYVAESADIFFEVAVKDDKGIAAVDFIVYVIDGFDPSSGSLNLSNTQKKLTQSLSQSGSDGDWLLFNYTWDSALFSDGFYLCEFEVQDTDEVANHLYIRVVLEIDNVEEQLTGFPNDQGSSGFLLIPGMLALFVSVRIIIWKRKSEV